MALRVLLADESTTIKKAIQMALSEYGVDVKSVPSGLDVLTVAHTFQPDFILADVLLSKRNGYQVCSELKADPVTRNIPVVLMWSSFMQIDKTQSEKSKADAVLEKPFDTDSLKKLIEKFVAKTNNFPLKGLLAHPPLPNFEESETFVRQKNELQNLRQLPTEAEETTQRISFEDIDDDEHDDFSLNSAYSQKNQSIPHQKNQRDSVRDKAFTHEKIIDPTEPVDDEWSSSSAGQFVIETESFGDYEEVTVINSKASQSSTPDLQRRIQQQVSTYLEDSTIAKSKAQTLAQQAPSAKSMTAFDEKILKEEIKQMAERICWQIIPDITEKIVREELNKLLQGLEKNI